jgi:nucleotide-binding universal stress UspA family protein
MKPTMICGVDDSRVSLAAAKVATALAEVLDHQLALVHVVEDPPTFPYRDSRLREHLRRDAIKTAMPIVQRVADAIPGGMPEQRVLLGDPVHALAIHADHENASLLIVGSRGRSALAAAVLGGVSGRLAREASCPVLVVPSVAAAERFTARMATGPVLCGMDGAPGSTDALRVATGLAAHIDVELRPVHVANVPAPGATLPEEIEQLRVHEQLRVYNGNAVRELHRGALRHSASLIVVGSRGQGPWRAALGSVASALAATAPVPVLVVSPSARQARFDAGEAAAADISGEQLQPVGQ